MSALRVIGIVVGLTWMLLGTSATMAEDCNDNGVFDHCDLDCGPKEASGYVMPSQECLNVFDFNADADLKDFASFQRVFTGGSE